MSKTLERKPRDLTCCCCGGRAYGRQWFGRDTGFGLCAACADWLVSRETPEEMRQNYGERGVHYSLPS